LFVTFRLTSSSSLSVALGTADVRPAFRFVAAIVYRERSSLKNVSLLNISIALPSVRFDINCYVHYRYKAVIVVLW